jgi:membrane protease YdiL (CAAX protease family)
MRAFGVRKVVSFYAALFGVALLGMFWRDGLPLWLPATPTAWVVALVAGVGSALVVVGLSRLSVQSFGWAARLSAEFRGIFGELDRRQTLALALASGFSEEALFRGVLQPALGLVVASLVFGLLHHGPGVRFVPWTLMAVGAGFLFGGLLYFTGTLVAPVVAHALINYLNLRHIAASAPHVAVDLGPVGGEGAVGS